MKKVLIITYHWPPSGGVTVLRCLKFVKYLRDYGWEPVVCTAKGAIYPFLDEGNYKDIPENQEVIRVPIWEPMGLFRKITGRKKDEPIQNITSTAPENRSIVEEISIWIRGNFFIPDARKFWIAPAVKTLSKYIQDNKIDAILTDGPPHTNTVIGMRLAKKFSIPWLADFQDPWTQADYYREFKISPLAHRIHKNLEQEVFKTASKVTVASDYWKKDLESIGAKNVDVIYYGYDEDDFKNYKSTEHEKLVFFHGGALGRDRNPEGFFLALSELIAQDNSLRERMAIRLAGEVDIDVKRTIEKYGLDEITSFLGMLPRKQIYLEYAASDILLLPINKAENAKGRIPAKLFEYLRAGKYILAFGPADGDVAAIVHKMNIGTCNEYENHLKTIEHLKKALRIVREGTLKQDNPSRFSNREQTKLIAKYLDKITGQR